MSARIPRSCARGTYVIRHGLSETNPETVGQVVVLLAILQGCSGGEGCREAEDDCEAQELHGWWM